MNRCAVAFVLVLLSIHLASPTCGASQEQGVDPHVAVGWDVAIGGLSELALNLAVQRNTWSLELLTAIGLEGPFREEKQQYFGVGTKGTYSLATSRRYNLYGFGLVWVCKVFDVETEVWESTPAIGFSAGLGSENLANGYFLELGYVKLEYISSFSLRAGRHFWF